MFGRIWTDQVGEHRGLFNIKLLGWAPLVMNIRILAVNSGLAMTNTLQRIAQLERDKRLGASSAAELAEAYHLLTGTVFTCRSAVARRTAELLFLDPAALADEEREKLRRALASIKDLQKVIRTNFRPHEPQGPS